MSLILRWLFSLAIAIAFGSCAEPQRSATKAAANVASAGSRFDQVGKVTFYTGEPCASQIMFVFRVTRSASRISLAAPMWETKILTDAVRRKRTVHVSGKWRRSKRAGCNYVEATQVEAVKSFW
jgi:hypothetical protein